MLCSFTTRLRNFICFLMFTFMLCLMPHFELPSPYKIHLFFSEAQAAETQATEPQETEQQVTELQTPKSEEQVSEETLTADETAAAHEPPPGEDPPPSPEDPQIQPNPVVSFAIDDFRGAAHLNYPIIVPPARSDLSPKLSLHYSSMAENTWLGIGWDFSTGFIQRRGSRRGVPKYNDMDVFELQLGGEAPQQLVSIGDSEYRLRLGVRIAKLQFIV